MKCIHEIAFWNSHFDFMSMNSFESFKSINSFFRFAKNESKIFNRFEKLNCETILVSVNIQEYKINDISEFSEYRKIVTKF